MVSHWSLNDSKSPQVSRTLLSIPPDLNDALAWMVSTHPFISMSSRPSTNALETVPWAQITISIIVTIMFHNFQISSEVQALIFHFVFFQFFSVVDPVCKVHNSASSLFLLRITRSYRLAEIRWSAGISKSQRSCCVSFSRTDSGLSIYYFSYGQISISCTIPAQSRLVLYSICAWLMYSLLMPLVVLSLYLSLLLLLFTH